VRGVLDAAAERFGWTRTRTPGRGYGLAAGTEKGSYLATCAEVSIEPGGAVRVRRLVTAFECGAVVNPTTCAIRSRARWSRGWGRPLRGGALRDGLITTGPLLPLPCPALQRRARAGRGPRRSQGPAFGGSGGNAAGVCRPAIGNAIFDATGTRLRSLPLVPSGLPKLERSL